MTIINYLLKPIKPKISNLKAIFADASGLIVFWRIIHLCSGKRSIESREEQEWTLYLTLEKYQLQYLAIS